MLFGHIGKIAKVAGGSFYTHNRMADGRMETIAAYAAAEGLPQDAVRQILAMATTEEALPLIRQYHLERVYDILAARAALRSERYVFQEIKVGVVMTTLKGEILGMDDTARKIGEDFGWHIALS